MVGNLTVKGIFGADYTENIHIFTGGIQQRLAQCKPGTSVVIILCIPLGLGYITGFVESRVTNRNIALPVEQTNAFQDDGTGDIAVYIIFCSYTQQSNTFGGINRYFQRFIGYMDDRRIPVCACVPIDQISVKNGQAQNNRYEQ